MGEIIRDAATGSPWYIHAGILISIGLIIAGFIIPPMGVIDGSVLMAVGEILGGITVIDLLQKLPEYIKAGANIKASKGDMTVEVTSGEKKRKNDQF